MSSIENRICTIVARTLGRHDGVQPDTPLLVGQNCSFTDLRKIAYAVSHKNAFNLPDFPRTHWELWLSVADIIIAVEKAQAAQARAQKRAA